jgi:hypothetical protein
LFLIIEVLPFCILFILKLLLNELTFNRLSICSIFKYTIICNFSSFILDLLIICLTVDSVIILIFSKYPFLVYAFIHLFLSPCLHVQVLFFELFIFIIIILIVVIFYLALFLLTHTILSSLQISYSILLQLFYYFLDL